jgi:hypothetical protein
MTRTLARLSALLVAGASLSAACGGKVAVDAANAESTGGGASSSPTGGAAPGSGGTTGGGGCDSASHTIDIAGYDTSCSASSDCIAVFMGDLCGNCTCANAAINAVDIMKYQAEVKAKALPPSPGGCFCPASTPICADGECVAQVP